MLQLARVVAVHPESNAVDIVILNTGQRFGGIQVMSPMAGGDVGLTDLPVPTVTDATQPFGSDNTGQRDVFAVVAFLAAQPVVLGFLFPQVAQCLFEDKNRRVYRHASDVYHTIDAAGNIELSHPSGTFIRIGETPEHEDLTRKDYDKTWVIDNNTDTRPHVSVTVANQNEVKTTLVIDPDGALSLSTVGPMTIESGADITITAAGNFKVNAARVDLN